jgi:hypothetical protein
MAQRDFNNLLGQVVDDSRGDLEAIIIFNLTDGFPLFSNKQLEETHLPLHKALFTIEAGAEETGLNDLSNIQDALNNFGKTTKSGNLEYSLFKLEKGTMMIYFYKLPDMGVAICFFAPKGINLGNVVFVARRRIEEIKAALDKM